MTELHAAVENRAHLLGTVQDLRVLGEENSRMKKVVKALQRNEAQTEEVGCLLFPNIFSLLQRVPSAAASFLHAVLEG